MQWIAYFIGFVVILGIVFEHFWLLFVVECFNKIVNSSLTKFLPPLLTVNEPKSLVSDELTWSTCLLTSFWTVPHWICVLEETVTWRISACVLLAITNSLPWTRCLVSPYGLAALASFVIETLLRLLPLLCDPDGHFLLLAKRRGDHSGHILDPAPFEERFPLLLLPCWRVCLQCWYGIGQDQKEEICTVQVKYKIGSIRAMHSYRKWMIGGE